MLSLDDAQKRAEKLVEAARMIGADAADALYICDASTQVQMSLGLLEDVERSEGEDIGPGVFSGRSSATVSSPAMSEDALAKHAERALAEDREPQEAETETPGPEELRHRKQHGG